MSDADDRKSHLARIHELPCIVCALMGMAQCSPTEANHLESVRDEDSAFGCVPLCRDHHRGPNGYHGLQRRGFYMRYKLDDIDLLKITVKMLMKKFVTNGA